VVFLEKLMSIIELKEHINRELKKLKETIEGRANAS
jgi:hypothetical protein